MIDKKGIISVIAAIIIVAVILTIVLVPHEIQVTHDGNGEVSTDGNDIRFYETITVTMLPDDGWHVDRILLDGEEVFFEGNSYEYSPSPFDFSRHTIHVVFERNDEPIPVPETHTISVTYTEGGTVSPSGNVIVEDGDSITFTISPDAGYVLDHLELDNVRISPVGTYTMSYVDSDHSLHAVFTKRPTTPGGEGGGSSNPTILTGIDLTSLPTNTVYSVGDSFDTTGMTVVANYSNGTSRVLSSSEYNVSPSGTLTAEDTKVLISYQGETATVSITVIDGSLFSTSVTSYHGTRVNGGSIEGFSKSPNCSLASLNLHTEGIVPGIRQILELSVNNGTGTALDAFLFIDGLSIDGDELAEQIVLTVTYDGNTVSRTISEVQDGNFLEIGQLETNEEALLTIELEFLNTEDNNEAMGQSISFSLGVSAYAATQ